MTSNGSYLYNNDDPPMMNSSSSSSSSSSSRMKPQPTSQQPELRWSSLIHAEIVLVTTAMRKNMRWNLNQVDYQPKPHKENSSSNLSDTSYDYCQEQRHNSLHAVMNFTKGRTNTFLGSVESPLLLGFSRLKARLTLLTDLHDMEPIHLLEPFLDVVKSGDTTGPITGAALGSIEKFIKYGILDPDHPKLPVAMSALTHSVTHCKFEATDAVSDEAVLAKILRLLRVTVTSEAGRKSLDDKGVCEMVEAAFGMCFQGRVSELLRRAAEHTLIILVQALFERLTVIMETIDENDGNPPHSIDNINENAEKFQDHSLIASQTAQVQQDTDHASISTLKTLTNTNAEKHEEDTNVPRSPISSPVISVDLNVLPTQVSVMGDDVDDDPGLHISLGPKKSTEELQVNTSGSQEPNTQPSESPIGVTKDEEKIEAVTSKVEEGKPEAANTGQAARAFEPFGLPAILELIRVLVSLIDPRNKQHTDTMHRRVSLGLMGIAIEVGGVSLNKWISRGAEIEKKQKVSDVKVQKPLDTNTKDQQELSDDAHRRPSVSVQQPSPEENVISVSNGAADIGAINQVRERATDDEALPSTASQPKKVASPADVDMTLTNAVLDGETDEERMSLAVKELITNELCKYLFQILQISNVTMSTPPSSAALSLFGLTLKLITSLFQTGRENLTLQHEWLLNWIMHRADAGVVGWDVEEGYISSNSTVDVDSPHHPPHPKGEVLVGEVRELLLECISQLARVNEFMADLYFSFDGQIKCQSHMFENLVRFLSKHSFPDATPGGPVTTSVHQLLCLDSLLVFLKHLVDRRTFVQDSSATEEATKLQENKSRKRVLMQGAEKFNQKPKEGIAFLQSHGFLPTPADSESLAHVLKYTPKINKTLLGEYISKKANLDLLKAFIRDFDFKGKRIDEALRLMLESFRLPGESQQIERIMEVFAETYYKSIENDEKVEIRTQDAAFILSYSVIMLNTDQHNPQVRRRMTLDEFRRNTRGVNDGQDFDPEYMKSIYTEIKNNEIVMPEEHEGDLGFNYAWRELVKRSKTIVPMRGSTPCRFDKDMFNTVWWPILAAISYAFDNAEDSLTLQKVIVGFQHLAIISAHYHQFEIFDSIIISLAKITGLLKESEPPAEPNVAEQQEGKLKRVDNWIVDFGLNYKGQVAAVLMFSLVNEYGNGLQSGWQYVVDCIRGLFIHALLPTRMLEVEDFVRKTIRIPRITPTTPISKGKDKERRDGTGILSTLSQFLSLSGGYDDEYEMGPSNREIEAESLAFECVRACKVEDLFSDSRFLEESALKNLLSSTVLASRVRSQNSPNRPVSHPPPLPAHGEDQGGQDGPAQRNEAENVAPPSMRENAAASPETSNTGQNETVEFSSAAVFFLEVMISISIQNRDRIDVVWPTVLNHINSILAQASSCPIALLERVVVGLFRLILRLVHNDEMLAQIFKSIEPLKNLPPDVFSGISQQLMAGISTVVKTDWSVFCKDSRWELILELLSLTSVHPDASKYAFEVASFIVSEQPEVVLVNPENFSECVDLFISFASAAGSLMVSSSVPNSTNGSLVTDNEPKYAGGMVGGGVSAGDLPSPKAVRKGARLQANSPSKQAAVDRAIKALDKLFRLHVKIPKLIEQTGITSKRAWFEFWLPILSGLGQQCYHPVREVRQQALTHLQRALLLPELEATTLDCSVDCFDNVLFPLLDELLKQEVCELDPRGMDETRMRAYGLLCKIFLHYLSRLIKSRELGRLWGRVLDYICRYLHTGGPEYLTEGVVESLKNVILVMSTQELFQIPKGGDSPTNGGVSLWSMTWEHLDPYLPNLKDEIFPNSNNVNKERTAAAAAAVLNNNTPTVGKQQDMPVVSEVIQEQKL